MKTLFGPDYRAIKTIRQQIEQNRVRIREMNRLHTNLKNQADQTQLASTIQTMESQNTALEIQVQTEENQKSLFGWLFRLFAK
jgi:outer membrane PBP1 activator LpoA protein